MSKYFTKNVILDQTKYYLYTYFQNYIILYYKKSQTIDKKANY